jgi:dTDP-4-amino-4,6-dideoxygalactose transaminase
MLTTDDDALAERLRLLRSHGMTTLTWDRHRGHAFSYDVVAPGYNYRIDEIRAAIGRAQLAKLAGNNRRRAQLDALYRALLPAAVPGLALPYATTRGEPAHHLRPVLLPPGADRPRFMAEMKARGIQTSIHYPPVHVFSYYHRDDGPTLPITEAVAAREVTLPLYPGMSPADVETVVAAAAEALAVASPA